MRKIIFISLLLTVFLSACSASELTGNTNSAVSQPERGSYSQMAANTSGGGGGNENPTAQKVSLETAETTQDAPTTIVERKIIRNANVKLEADNPDEALAKITNIAESKTGFVVKTEQTSNNAETKKSDVITMTVRVPSEKFNETLGEIRGTASRVINETVEGKDVTEEFIDIEARLKTKKALEQQFLEIMKRSNTVEDALNVQRQLAEVRGEIEQIEGRKRFLENQASLSTIEIRIESSAGFSTSSTGFFYQLGESFSSGFDFALNFVLGLVTLAIALLPFLIFIALPLYFLIRYFMRKNRKRDLAQKIAREESVMNDEN